MSTSTILTPPPTPRLARAAHGDRPGVAIIGHGKRRAYAMCGLRRTEAELVGTLDVPPSTRGLYDVGSLDALVDDGAAIFVIASPVEQQPDWLEEIVARTGDRRIVVVLAAEGAIHASALTREEQITTTTRASLMHAHVFSWQVPAEYLALCLKRIGPPTAISVHRMHRLRHDTLASSPTLLLPDPLDWLFGALEATALGELGTSLRTDHDEVELTTRATVQTRIGAVKLTLVTGYAATCPFEVTVTGPGGLVRIKCVGDQLKGYLEGADGRVQWGFPLHSQSFAWRNIFDEASNLIVPPSGETGRRERERLVRAQTRRECLISQLIYTTEAALSFSHLCRTTT